MNCKDSWFGFFDLSNQKTYCEDLQNRVLTIYHRRLIRKLLKIKV